MSEEPDTLSLIDREAFRLGKDFVYSHPRTALTNILTRSFECLAESTDFQDFLTRLKCLNETIEGGLNEGIAWHTKQEEEEADAD